MAFYVVLTLSLDPALSSPLALSLGVPIMSDVTDPRGLDSGTVAVRVEYVHRLAEPIQIILLGDPYGLLLHYVRSGSIPCIWPAACKAHTGRPPKWHGFAACLY